MKLFICVTVTELVGPKWRIYPGIALAIGWAFGYMIVAGMSYAIRDWRRLSLANTGWFAILLPLTWYVYVFSNEIKIYLKEILFKYIFTAKFNHKLCLRL